MVNQYILKIIGWFEGFILCCIVLNIVTMAMSYEGAKAEYDEALENVNLGFTSVFIMETTFKIIAYGFVGFWASGWN